MVHSSLPPSIILSSHNGLPPAAFLVNDHILYSSRISVIIDFVQTVCIPQCVLNPTPKRCWTLSHLIRLHKSALQWDSLYNFSITCLIIGSPFLDLINVSVNLQQWNLFGMTACYSTYIKPKQVWACLAFNKCVMLFYYFFSSLLKKKCQLCRFWLNCDSLGESE